jgi:hypothetical protein
MDFFCRAVNAVGPGAAGALWSLGWMGTTR